MAERLKGGTLFNADLIEKSQQIVWQNHEMKLSFLTLYGRSASEKSNKRFSSAFVFDINSRYDDKNQDPILDGFSFYSNPFLVLERKLSFADRKNIAYEELPLIRFDAMDAVVMVNSLNTVQGWLQEQSNSVFTKDGTGKITSVVHVNESFRMRTGRMIAMIPEILTEEVNSDITYEGIGVTTDDLGKLGSMSPFEFVSFKRIFEFYASSLVLNGNIQYIMSMVYGMSKNVEELLRRK